jgi:putative ABC transport system permease protein
LLISLASGVRRQIRHQFESIGLDRLTVFPSGGWGGFGPFADSSKGKPITPEQITRWKNWPGVATVTPQINLPAGVHLEVKWKGKSHAVRMSGGMGRPGPGGGMWQGRSEALSGSIEPPAKGAIILSRGSAQALGLGSNDWSSLPGQMVETVLREPRGETQTYSLRIQGVSSEKATTIEASTADCLAMKEWWFNSTNLLQTEGYDSVAIKAADVTLAKDLAARFRKDGVQVQSLEMFMEVANRILAVVTIMLSLVAGVALFVASIGIANTMVMAVYERTREIGILKAMGASRTDIRRLFMIEAGFIGLGGGIVGLLAGWGLGAALNQGLHWYSLHHEPRILEGLFYVTPLLAVGVTIFATLIGVLAGLLPAHRAARLDPLTALRHE